MMIMDKVTFYLYYLYVFSSLMEDTIVGNMYSISIITVDRGFYWSGEHSNSQETIEVMKVQKWY